MKPVITLKWTVDRGFEELPKRYSTTENALRLQVLPLGSYEYKYGGGCRGHRSPLVVVQPLFVNSQYDSSSSDRYVVYDSGRVSREQVRDALLYSLRDASRVGRAVSV